MDLTSLLDSLQTVLMLVLPVIGITGGLKGLFGKVPDLDFAGLAIPGGLVASWGVALVWVVGRMALGIDAPPADADALTWIGAQWALVAATANVVRNWIKGAA